MTLTLRGTTVPTLREKFTLATRGAFCCASTVVRISVRCSVVSEAEAEPVAGAPAAAGACALDPDGDELEPDWAELGDRWLSVEDLLPEGDWLRCAGLWLLESEPLLDGLVDGLADEPLGDCEDEGACEDEDGACPDVDGRVLGACSLLPSGDFIGALWSALPLSELCAPLSVDPDCVDWLPGAFWVPCATA
jgi:hypothetical protein